jgi:hypothetical protein
MDRTWNRVVASRVGNIKTEWTLACGEGGFVPGSEDIRWAGWIANGNWAREKTVACRRLSSVPPASEGQAGSLSYGKALAFGGIEGFLQTGFVGNALKALDGLAAFEDQERGDRFDAVLEGGLLIIVNVYFADLDGTCVLRGQLVDHRCDLAAGAAPGRPKIHEHGLIAAEDIGLKTVVGKFENVCGSHVKVSLLLFDP